MLFHKLLLDLHIQNINQELKKDSMEAMIQQLKQMVIDQDFYVDCLNKRLASAMKNVTTEEGCNECERVFKKVCEEQVRLRDLKQSLYYMRRAAGHEDIDTFNPERF